jgi:hypothetical protein
MKIAILARISGGRVEIAAGLGAEAIFKMVTI